MIPPIKHVILIIGIIILYVLFLLVISRYFPIASP